MTTARMARSAATPDTEPADHRAAPALDRRRVLGGLDQDVVAGAARRVQAPPAGAQVVEFALTSVTR